MRLRKILVLHGPNINLLGEREPEVYGTRTLVQCNREIRAYGKKSGCVLKIHQSNHEGVLIDLLHQFRHWAEGIVFNPGAYTHYSYALRDAVAAIQVPTIEVHLSSIHKRESFRKVSVIAPVCRKQISGLGLDSYLSAIDELKNGFESNHSKHRKRST